MYKYLLQVGEVMEEEEEGIKIQGTESRIAQIRL